MGEYSSNFGVQSSKRVTTKTAWATYARQRFPIGGVKLAQAEWGLTEGEAKGLFAGQISQPTIDKIIDHKRGGFGLHILIGEIRLRTSLHAWVQSEKQRLAHEAAQAANDAEALGEMARHLPAVLGLAPGRPPGVGAGRGGERRSFSGELGDGTY